MKSFNGYFKLELGNDYVLLAGGSHKALSDFSMSGHNHNDLYVSSLTTSGNYLRWVKNGSNNDITIPYATNADTVDNIHATGFLRWKGMLNIGNHAPFQAVVDIIKDTTKLNDGGLAMYSYAGDEYTVLIGSRNDATRHGNALKWGYANRYLWLIRMISGNPQSSDWEKISAGYADSAGNASTLGGTAKSGLFTSFSRPSSTNNLSITVGGTTKAVTLGARAFDDTAYLPLSGGTMTGGLTVKLYIFGFNYNHAGANAPAFVFDKPGANYTGIGANGENDTIYFSAATLSNGEASWVTSYKQKWKFNGTIYQEGNAVIHAGNIGSQRVTYATTAGSAPASDVYSWAKASTKPSYSFNEIGTGAAIIGNGTNYLLLRNNSSWYSGMYYQTDGDESIVFGNKNTRASWIFANTDPTARASWTTLTPCMQIKNRCVYINKLIENSASGSYNLWVNGNFRAEALVIEQTNEINSYNGMLHLNYRVNTNVTACLGGGNVGIGTVSPSYKLHINGNCGASNFYTTSDSRKKKEIKQISNSIYQFKLKDLDTLLYGYIAQELEKTNPELVDSSGEYKTVNYNSAICYNISKIENTMKAKIIEMEKRIDKLENKILGGQVRL